MRRVSRRLQTAAALLTALVLLAPATAALAQSAGDTQYADPLAGGGSTSKTHASTKTTKTAPSVTKAPPVSLPSSTTTTPSSSSSSSSSSSPTSLPRTGLDEWTLIGLAAALLLAGVGLRMRTAGVRRR
jgi:hypothetical protein